MIRAGRDVVDRSGIGELHGMTERQARRYKPWAADGHPASVTPRGGHQGYPELWDREQAEAFAQGAPVPEVPDARDHRADTPEDLLDRFEAAEVAEVKSVTWEMGHQRGRTPEPDAEPFGVPHWHRRTVEAYRAKRGQLRTAPHPGGRPPGTPARRPPGEVRAAIGVYLAEAAHAGTPVTTAEAARRAGVHYTTAHRHVTAIRRGIASS